MKENTFPALIEYKYWGRKGFRATHFIIEGQITNSYTILYGIEIGRLEIIVNNPFAKDENGR